MSWRGPGGPAEVQALMPWVAWSRPSAFLMSSGRCCYFQPQGTLGRKVLEVSAPHPVHTPKKENPAGGSPWPSLALPT